MDEYERAIRRFRLNSDLKPSLFVPLDNLNKEIRPQKKDKKGNM